jgi:glycosyltransferase involved in cell wall biosynthesis
VGGIPETVRDGVEGLLVPPHDEGALADAIERLLENPSLGAELAGRASQRVEEEYSANALAERLGALYDDLLANASRRRSRSGD